MAIGEFELIDRHFRKLGASRADVILGVGDDGAILRPPPDCDLVAVSDTLVEGVHFPAGSAPRSIGHRALAVNLSDIAAMGASAAWSLLSITLPRVEDSWLDEFAAGFGELAREHGVSLVGGDTTRGPLTIGVQVLGFLRRGEGLRRGGGRPGDLLCVSGTPGDAAVGLHLLQTLSAEGGGEDGAAADAEVRQARAELCRRFGYPSPRLALGQELLGLASACIDISDGLLGDVGKLAAASGCGALIDLDLLSRSSALATLVAAGGVTEREALRAALGGGDDYELAFTVPRTRRAGLDTLRRRHAITVIGELTDPPAAGFAERVRLRAAEAAQIELAASAGGFDHFAG